MKTSKAIVLATITFIIGLVINVEYNHTPPQQSDVHTAGSTQLYPFEPTAGFHVEYQGRSLFCENTINKDNQVTAICFPPTN